SEAASLAADSEAAELIQKLDLKGQQTLLNSETVSRFPYRKMTLEESKIYAVLCPNVTRAHEYSDAIIPIRVLQVLAHAQELNFCDRFYIWHPESADIKDPVLVGVKGPEYGDQERFILARWGEELPSLEELREKAIKKWRDTQKQVLLKIRSEVQQHIDAIDS